MISIAVGEFRATMNAVLHRVQQGEVVTLTSRGTEVAKLVPPSYAQWSARQQLVRLRETAVVGDVLAPLDEPWEAN